MRCEIDLIASSIDEEESTRNLTKSPMRKGGTGLRGKAAQISMVQATPTVGREASRTAQCVITA
jgi:hypothetical protein